MLGFRLPTLTFHNKPQKSPHIDSFSLLKGMQFSYHFMLYFSLKP